jgi:hypothetical protein
MRLKGGDRIGPRLTCRRVVVIGGRLPNDGRAREGVHLAAKMAEGAIGTLTAAKMAGHQGTAQSGHHR